MKFLEIVMRRCQNYVSTGVLVERELTDAAGSEFYIRRFRGDFRLGNIVTGGFDCLDDI